MKIKLAYGRDGLSVDLPDYRAQPVPRLRNEPKAVRSALRHPINSAPLARKLNSGDSVVAVHSDNTGPILNNRVLPVLLAELEQAGIERVDITVHYSLVTHRPRTAVELRSMLGISTVDTYRCVWHKTFDDSSLISLGDTSRGYPVRINKSKSPALLAGL